MDWDRLANIDPNAIGEVIRNPADHPVSIAFLLAIVTLVLLIALLITLMILVGRQDTSSRSKGPRPPAGQAAATSRPGSVPAARRDARSVDDDPRSPGKRKRPPSGLFLALVIFAFGFSVYIPASLSSTCVSGCHTVSYEAKSWSTGRHAKVSCVRCHEPRPVLLFGENVVDRVSNAARWLASQPSSATVTTVDDHGCIRCHRRDIEGVVQGPGASDAIRMRHSDVLKAGYHCTDCHRDTGHAVVDAAPGGSGGMRRCLTCHDNRRASSECRTCHSGDVMLAKVAKGDPYPKIELRPRKDCSGCHSMKKCDACHGLRLPHPQDFVDGGHARLAAWEKKKACWRCHEPGDCGMCHTGAGGETFSAHPDRWRWLHGIGTDPDTPNACRSCHHIKPGKPLCRFCHLK